MILCEDFDIRPWFFNNDPLSLSLFVSQSFFEGQSAPWDSAKKDENRMKNRYGNIIACVYCIVLLYTHLFTLDW